MTKIDKKGKDIKKSDRDYFKDYWTKPNYIFLIISTVVLILGYVLMMNGSWDSFLSMSVSPVVLILAYVILIPAAILFKIPQKIKNKADVPGKD